MATPKTSLRLAGLILAVLLAGCAEGARTRVALPPLAESPVPQTIFGEATLGGGRPGEAEKAPLAPRRPLTLDECLALAKKVSPSLDSADQNYVGAMWDRWSSITAFLPTASMGYGLTRYNDLAQAAGAGRSRYVWQTQVTQTVFAGGRDVSNYLLAQLGVNAAEIQRIQAEEDLLLSVKQSYYGILAVQKALAVAKQTVINLQSHLKVAQNFYDVGMVPKNQVLAAEVELAKAVQNETDLTRDLAINKSRLNILLRQPIENPVEVVDTLKYAPFPLSIAQCMEISLADSPEMKLGRNQAAAGAKSVDVARSAYYPELSAEYVNASTGDSPRAHGGWSTNDAGWNVALMASFNIWEWGRTKANVEKSKVGLNRAVNNLTLLEDNARLEVTSNYQNLVSAGKNIDVSAKAVIAADEDLRMMRERYLEQVATNTEVLDAQTRYSQAQYDHYQSLYNYNLAWATLERSLGRQVAHGL
ncbi:MAG: TolC family protein [Candidatus Adiutrix sp.]|jgi:outer membrane protein|nr:TolC family protein [Candidatus Adiutrix sp.]